jgi:hypothetical protein
VDLASARWVEPAGVGALLQQYFDSALLLEFNQLAPTLDVLMSLSALPGQDLCELTVDQPPGDFSQDPYFSVGPATVAFDMQGIDIAWEGMNLTGTFSPDGSTLEGVTLIATQDTRPLVQLIGGYGDDAVCDLVLAFGVSCVACPSDGQPYCLTTRVDNMIGQLEPGIDLVPITPSDVDNNPSCN